VRFCVHHPEECQPSAPATELLGSVQTDAMELARQTNDRVNASIKAQADPDRPDGDVWTLGPLAGDCDDFAVTKRSLLIKAGMSSSNVLLAHVVTRQGEDHLVTVVRMNDGDFVLDNLDRTVRPVSETRYRWVSIQSSEDPRFWHRAELQARPLLLARF
jgi:predicted transglutaminase-like cysteine proteinase